MEYVLISVCWLVFAGDLLDSCRQCCQQSTGGGPLMEGVLDGYDSQRTILLIILAKVSCGSFYRFRSYTYESYNV